MSDKQHLLANIKEILHSDSEFAELSKASKESLEELIQEIKSYTEKIQEEQKPVFKIMATATAFLPNFLISKLAQEMLTPYLVAQVTNHLSPRDAAKIGVYFEKPFLGEVALYAEIQHVAAITKEMPFDVAFTILDNMLKKNYHHRIAQIADRLPIDLLVRFLAKFKDAEPVAKIMQYMENTATIDAVFGKESPERKALIQEVLKGLQS